MPSSQADVVRSLEEALSLDENGLVSRPLDVIGLIGSAALINSTNRELLWRRLYLEAPIPYWLIVRWAQKTTSEGIPSVLKSTVSPGWSWSSATLRRPSIDTFLCEVADRFDEFDPEHFSFDYGIDDHPPPQVHKYLLGREMARSYVTDAAFPKKHDLTKRQEILQSHKEAWSEWSTLNTINGHSSDAVCEATALALDHIVSSQVTTGITGIGRTHILLEQLHTSKNPAVGVVTASLLPVDASRKHLDGLVVPDLRENGLLVMSDEFLAGVGAAWRYSRSVYPFDGPTILCFSIRPNVASVVQQLSGRSAEMAVLAAIESAIHKRALRADAAASATLTLYGADGIFRDPPTGPASFEDEKYIAALRHKISTVVVHADVARKWKNQNQALTKDRDISDPDVVASEFFRRDAIRFLETRSLWKISITVPAIVSISFAALALLWQFYKVSANPSNLDTIVIASNLPLISPALLGIELFCLFLSLFILQFCSRSIRLSLDSAQSSLLALGVCTLVVLAAQFLPIGVRYEGLLDNPLYSVLFGEPQITAESVINSGGAGFLALHTISQTVGFLTILYGVCAFTIRLIQARAHSEPHFEDRCELIKKDWLFSMSLMAAFLIMLVAICLPRNTLWYYYLTTLPSVSLIDREGSFLSVVAPLLGITVVLTATVSFVWLFVLHSYLIRAVDTARGRSGYTSKDVVATLPRLAKLLYMARVVD